MLELEYKPDLEVALKRMDAFWKGETLDMKRVWLMSQAGSREEAEAAINLLKKI